MKRIFLFLSILLLCAPFSLKAQLDDLEAQLMSEMEKPVDYAVSTFLSENIVVGQSTTMHEKNNLSIIFKHHFGSLKGGPKEIFGLNDANIYVGLGYAPADWVNLGLGYGTYNNSFNGDAKFRILRQSTGRIFMPVNLVLYGAINCRTQQYANPDMNKNFAGRLDYTVQALISRRFCDIFSLQIAPTYVHRNLVATAANPNDLFALGAGASFRLLKNLRLNLEYYWVTDHDTPKTKYYDPFSIGVSYQTSRHTFELFLSNTEFMESNYFLTSTTGNFFKGDIHIGFNCAINFTLGKKH
ncbi:MAG: DUF5777 family beta-barrel protein [Bacteroidales bacterium]|nr:DUF5777 family beta-barrel protein [Bacteroidales bacterium]